MSAWRGRPAPAERAAKGWRAECDPLKRFLEERTGRAEDASVRASELYDAYQKWAAENGERVESKTAFGRRMTGLGYERGSNNGVVYHGLSLI
jgi:putative DNA primase/helicase